MFVRINLRNRKQHARRKTTSDIVCCTSILQKLYSSRTACRRIFRVYEEDVVDNTIVCLWFRKFWDEDRSCKDHARIRRLPVIPDEDLDTAITNSPHLTVEELAKSFSVRFYYEVFFPFHIK